MPRPIILLRLVGFAVAAGLAIAGVQPVVASAAGSLPVGWAVGLSVPTVLAAALVFGAVQVFNRGNAVQPPWYSAWLLFPGSFLLAGAAVMCIFGALVQAPLIPLTLWVLLVSGGSMWIVAMVLVRSYAESPFSISRAVLTNACAIASTTDSS